jgi:hypothetical protein
MTLSLKGERTGLKIMFGGRNISYKDKNGYPISGMGGQVPVQSAATASPAPAPAAAKKPEAEKPKKKWYHFW